MTSAALTSVALVATVATVATDTLAPAKPGVLQMLRSMMHRLARPFGVGHASEALARCGDAQLADIGPARTDVASVRGAYMGSMHSD